MKKVLVAVGIMFGAYSIGPVALAAEEKRVCIDVKDKEGKPVMDKNGKVKQECKTIKVHKKLEGTEVPGQKK